MNTNYFTKRMSQGDYLVYSTFLAVMFGVSVYLINTVSMSLYYDYYNLLNVVSQIGFLLLVAVITIISIRRLHDIGLNGLIILTPSTIISILVFGENWLPFSIVGIVIIAEIIFLNIKKGMVGPNTFGEMVESKKRKNITYGIIAIVGTIAMVNLLWVLVNIIARFSPGPYEQPKNVPALTL